MFYTGRLLKGGKAYTPAYTPFKKWGICASFRDKK